MRWISIKILRKIYSHELGLFFQLLYGSLLHLFGLLGTLKFVINPENIINVIKCIM